MNINVQLPAIKMEQVMYLIMAKKGICVPKNLVNTIAQKIA
jgi:hypothetical protein